MAGSVRLPRSTKSGAKAAVVAAVVLVSGGIAGCGALGSNLPVKPAAYVKVLDPESPMLPSGQYVPEDESLLLGPNFGIRAEQVSAVEEITEDDAQALGLSEPFRAAEGHELLMLKLSGNSRWVDGRWNEEDATPKAAVVVGERETELDGVPKPGSVIIASAPVGANTKLSVTDHGRVQSLNLRTGTRAADAVGSIPSQQRRVEYHEAGQVSGYGSRELDVRITIDSVRLEPYLPDLGWAESGRGWLVLNLPQVSSDGWLAEPGEPAVGFFVDPSKTFTLRWGNGNKAQAAGGRGLNTASPTARYIAVLDVPASFRAGVLTISPDGPLFTYRGTSSLSMYTNLDEVPDCNPNSGPVACLAWAKRPKPEDVQIRLAE